MDKQLSLVLKVVASLREPALDELNGLLESGIGARFNSIEEAGRPFFTALLHCLYPQRNIVIVLADPKEQEVFHHDLSIWLGELCEVCSSKDNSNLLFYPAWDILPEDGRLPHSDTIGERLLTLYKLLTNGSDNFAQKKCGGSDEYLSKGNDSKRNDYKHSKIIVTNVSALLQKTFSKEFLQAETVSIKRGDRLELQALSTLLVKHAYANEVKVTQKGEFAIRGGILDVFPLTRNLPVRIEFFGDEVDSLREFDPITQISQGQIEEVIIPPAGEYGILKHYLIDSSSDTIPRIEASLIDYLEKDSIVILSNPTTISEKAEWFASLIKTEHKLYFDRGELIAKIKYKKIPVIEFTDLYEQELQAVEIKNNQSGGQKDKCDKIEKDLDAFDTQEGTKNSRPQGQFEDFAEPEQPKKSSEPEVFNEPTITSLNEWRPILSDGVTPQIDEEHRRLFFEQIHRWLRQGYDVRIFCANEAQLKRFVEIWSEYGFETDWIIRKPEGFKIELEPTNGVAGQLADAQGQLGKRDKRDGIILNKPSQRADENGISLYYGGLTCGFIIDSSKLVVITDSEIYGRRRVLQSRRLKSYHQSITAPGVELDFSDIEEGDYVVHLNYGIGRYLGLQKVKKTRKDTRGNVIQTDGEEYIVIEYAPSRQGEEPPKLYVPISEAHLVSKYIGTSRGKPILNKLTGKRWHITKAKAESDIMDYAAELLRVQALRMAFPGHAFKPDTPWQREFEATFQFEETPDQLKAIEETKADMESPRPMDRLICGDAGYGKTEVAIRAAFKAVMDGKQVAMLAPTTVLAHQHYKTFSERMAGFPVKIEMLSRFRTAAKQKEILKALSIGAIDIIIGTHRLLQSDVVFRDLGLVIIDEEQRFGVKHKERLKQLCTQVDVLTLSATPIPRTLYLALAGARDMSIIQTPPYDRLPAETIVTKYDEKIIREAIMRELARGGQVYFLHNQIYDIEEFGEKLQRIVPEAKIVIGHGRMSASELERVMNKFVSGEADVLLSTTIVENGLDIPNANTIIIDRPDRFGLSDLYQLRGRVGRYKHQAYAYLLLRTHEKLLANARKRISAIKQFSSLGSGFKIAMRDLEIRGAGEILGYRQSGHIAAIGFDLYCKLLKKCIAKLKKEETKIPRSVKVQLDFLAISPGDELPAPELTRARKPKKHVISVPRETAYYVSDDIDSQPEDDGFIGRFPAYIPASYIKEPSLRIEIYRKIAQAVTCDELKEIENEIRDRFGQLPDAVKRFLSVANLKLIASDKGIESIETKGSRLILTRNSGFISMGGKFPRLTKKTPDGRLKEIEHLLKNL